MNLVVGLGLTGQSVLSYLTSAGEPMLAFDTREDFRAPQLEQNYPAVKFAYGTLPNTWKKKISRIILSPGVARTEAWIASFEASGVEVIGDIELFARAASKPIIAITGSNGKSTVTTLVSELLQQAGFQVGMGGNIGRPALDLLLDPLDYDLYVLELSSFQLETTYSLHSLSSVVLNISEDHMDRYPSLDAYIQAKTKIYNDTELAVLPKGHASDFWVTRQTKKVYFGLEHPQSEQDYGVVLQDNQAWLSRGSRPLVKVSDMLLNAPHYQLNALAAIALCQDYDLSEEVFTDVLSRFRGLAHRTQWVATHHGVSWIDDSKGTNVGATLTAIQSLGYQAQQQGGKLILLAGGVGKGADFSPLASSLNQYAKQLVLFGRDQHLIEQALTTELDGEILMSCTQTLEQAVAVAKQNAVSGDIVLLSPACASFDQFENYHDRGEKFAAWVKQALELDRV
ncbi:UDP-N-acetylmuramoyl-L-alanine--D-glutamate ligase [Thiomicrospira microaerophila]|nr:UDP-N-acetylmuramoyl-L-alanine--D-glutamate ligase [Thiomicrospira microaerophila]